MHYAAVASRQLGLVTTTQLRELGWDKDAVNRAARRGQLEQVRVGVWRVAGAPVSREQMWLAAALAVPRSVLCHATAWTGWGLAVSLELDAIDLVLEGSDRPRTAGVRGHRTISLPAAHVARLGALPITSVERTIVDACGLVRPWQLERTVKDAVRRRLTTLPRLARCVDEVPVSGRRPSAPIREVLAGRIPGYDPGDSDAEADVVELVVRAGYPKPQQNVKVTIDGDTYEVDVAWVEIKSGFEFDSLEYHGDAFAFHRDRKKLRMLRRAGWRVDPITSETSANEILAIVADFFAPTTAAFGQ